MLFTFLLALKFRYKTSFLTSYYNTSRNFWTSEYQNVGKSEFRNWLRNSVHLYFRTFNSETKPASILEKGLKVNNIVSAFAT